MAKRRKPKQPLQSLLIVDDRNQGEDAWILAAKLPDKDCYGWSAPVLICQFVPGDLNPTLMKASYDFRCQQWRSPMGEIENVTHWQPLPDYPKEYE